ncbi:uncharacterized protein LOC124406578 [Diprion similis]|uniref:uncharacterized protein LOC124406578 n=1 Tax=Diprion similis TaxID=362088 RepID=UPI001EF88FDB|nr:uncharacterized protein LOC124406578 [Diprion similis]
MESAKCSKLINIMESAYKMLNKSSPTEIQKWIKFGTQNIRLLNKILRKASTMGEKMKIITDIGLLKSLTEKFKRLRTTGDGTRKQRRSDHVHWEELESAFKGRIRTGSITNLKHKDVERFLEDAKLLAVTKLKNDLKKARSLKVNAILACKFEVKKDDHTVEENKFFNTRNEIILLTTDIKEWFIENVTNRLLTKVEDFQEKDSGWSLLEIINLAVNINKYTPLRGGLNTYTLLPKHISDKKAVVNIRNNDSYCFLWSVTAALRPAENKNPNKISSYPHFSEVLRYDSINFPMSLHKNAISKFEKLNGLSINVFDLNETKVELPTEEEKILKFKNLKHKETVPFCIYADLECLLQATNIQVSENRTICQNHIPYSIAYYLHCTFNDSISEFKINRGKTCIEWFVNKLEELAHSLKKKYLKNIVRMESLNFNQINEFNLSKVCHICEKPFTREAVKHRDHCHFTGRYRGPAHQSCNLNYRKSHTIPVIFHNLSGYDSHFLIKALATTFQGTIQLLPVNKEKYISFTKFVKGTNVQLRFIDSYRFMPSSLEKLAMYLNDNQKAITRKFCTSSEKFELLTRKGVFPYEYMDSWEKLEDVKLPPKEKFYSKLNNQGISDEDYAHACKVWQAFNLKTLGEYSDLYLQTDVFLLADVFENFRQNCYATYNLDPLHYHTAPGLSFDAMLKCTGIELELLTDIDMLMFIEKGIRGGVSQCSNRYAKANNRYMGDAFNPALEESYLMYFDVNNLYGAAMSFALPCSSFEWILDFRQFDVFAITDEAEFGYLLEVDLEYPKELHEMHKDLPLCPEHCIPPISKSKQPKLMTTLLSKQNYVVHYRVLKQCLELGLKLAKIHRVLKFRQTPWLKKKYRDVRLITKWDGRYGARATIAKPNFHSCTIFDQDMIIVELRKTTVKLNKPLYAGFSILDLAKTFIYDFHYKYVKTKFGHQAKLMYTDTDSLIYHFTVPNIYECIKQDLDKFDTSDYPPDNVYGMPLVNKKVLGLMKDECNGKIMAEFIGLRAKLYSFRVMGEDKDQKRAKGVKGSLLKTITFDDYLKCASERENLVERQSLIQSQKHQVYTIEQKKVALSWNDDKRKLFRNTTDTVPWGYETGS